MNNLIYRDISRYRRLRMKVISRQHCCSPIPTSPLPPPPPPPPHPNFHPFPPITPGSVYALCCTANSTGHARSSVVPVLNGLQYEQSREQTAMKMHDKVRQSGYCLVSNPCFVTLYIIINGTLCIAMHACTQTDQAAN